MLFHLLQLSQLSTCTFYPTCEIRNWPALCSTAISRTRSVVLSGWRRYVHVPVVDGSERPLWTANTRARSFACSGRTHTTVNIPHTGSVYLESIVC